MDAAIMTMPTLFKAIKGHIVPPSRDVYSALHEFEVCFLLIPDGPEKARARKALKYLHNLLAGYITDIAGVTIGESDDADITLFSGGTNKDNDEPPTNP